MTTKSTCCYCERPFGLHNEFNTNKTWKTKDHFIPSSKGGYGRLNIVHACFACNHFKANLTPDEFLVKLDSVINSKNKTAYRTDYEKLFPTIRKNVLRLMKQMHPYKHRIKRKPSHP